MVATSLCGLVELVEAGLGTTFLPQMAVDAGLIDGGGSIRCSDTHRRYSAIVAISWPAELPLDSMNDDRL